MEERKTKGKTTEETFNQALGAALCRTAASWREGTVHVEETNWLEEGRGTRIDILIADPSLPYVAIETSFQPNDANSDAIKRLGKKIKKNAYEIRTALSVYIPDGYREKNLEHIRSDLCKEAPIDYALYQMLPATEHGSSFLRWPESGFLRGSVYDLSRFLQAAVMSKEFVEKVADEVAEMVNQAVCRLRKELSTKQQEQITEKVYQHSVLGGLRTSMVLWLNALLTQQRLHSQEVKGAPPLSFSGEASDVLASEQVTIWRDLIKKNWRSIFDPATSSLATSNDFSPSATKQALELLVEAVEKIERKKLGLYISVGAELFPKLSDDRKEAAAFYTQPWHC